MNRFTELALDTKKEKKTFSVFMLLFCLLPTLIDTLLITPLYATLSSDVAFSGGILTIALYYLKDIINIFAFASAYAIIIFGVFFMGRRSARLVILIYSLIYLAQIPLKLLVNVFVYGSLGSSEEILVDIIYLSFYFALYMLQLLAVYFFAVTDTDKHLRYVSIKRKKDAKRRDGESAPILPISKLFDRFNPIQRSALKMSILVFAVRIISRFLNDISYGAPTSFGEVLVMIVYYVSDIIWGIIAYVSALLIFSVLYDRLKKKDQADAPVDASAYESSIF